MIKKRVNIRFGDSVLTLPDKHGFLNCFLPAVKKYHYPGQAYADIVIKLVCGKLKEGIPIDLQDKINQYKFILQREENKRINAEIFEISNIHKRIIDMIKKNIPNESILIMIGNSMKMKELTKFNHEEYDRLKDIDNKLLDRFKRKIRSLKYSNPKCIPYLEHLDEIDSSLNALARHNFPHMIEDKPKPEGMGDVKRKNRR